MTDGRVMEQSAEGDNGLRLPVLGLQC